MPDKRMCGKTCIRCWRNKLKHGNPISKKWMKKNDEKSYATFGEIKQTEMSNSSYRRLHERCELILSTADKKKLERLFESIYVRN